MRAKKLTDRLLAGIVDALSSASAGGPADVFGSDGEDEERRFNRRFFPFTSFRSLLGIGADSESATYAELYSGEWEHPSFAVGG